MRIVRATLRARAGTDNRQPTLNFRKPQGGVPIVGGTRSAHPPGMRHLLPALAVLLLLASPAAAAPRWLDAEPPFPDTSAGDASAAMAPDGTVIYARFSDYGALEVRERPPGGPV